MRVTLNDIAKLVGVSPSTVQRALNGLSGVGQAKRDEIRRLADQMGYRRNVQAFSLRKGAKTIAVVLPNPARDNRYYARYLWEGALDYHRQYTESVLEVMEFPYVREPEMHAEKIREVVEGYGERLDGLLTMGFPEAGRFLAPLHERGVPVVFVGTDGKADDRACCIRTYDDMTGRMAADLLVNFTDPGRGRKVIVTGDMRIVDQYYNAQGFERGIFESGFPLEIFKLANHADLGRVKEAIREILDSSLDVAAVYATSARNTMVMCQAIAESGRSGTVRSIGSDIFPESVEMLRDGRLNATIHKRPSVQAFRAMRTLVDLIMRDQEPASELILIDPVIVMRSNIDRFV